MLADRAQNPPHSAVGTFTPHTSRPSHCRSLGRRAIYIYYSGAALSRKYKQRPMRLGSAAVGIAAAFSMQPLDAEDNWQALAGSYPRGWSGWQGLWGLFDTNGNKTKGWTGARLFHNDGDGSYEQVNVYDQVVGAGDPGKQRDDGGYEKSWPFIKADSCRADGWWHPYLKEGGPVRSRILGISPSRTATACFALPLKEFLKQDDAPPPFWNMELFVRPDDSERSYSCGAAYDVATGAFQTLFYIREARTLEGPAERSADWSPIDSACRPSLPADVSEWAGGQGVPGVSQQLVFDDDGGIVISAEEATAFKPPSNSLRITRLPDAMYMAYPGQLPTTLSEVPAEGVALEFGGLRPAARQDSGSGSGGSGFSRTVLHYSSSGRIRSIRFDDF